MSFKTIMLETATKWLVGGELFAFITDAVAVISNEDLSGDQKRTYVFTEAKAMFSGVFTLFVNLAIEVAVLLMREKLGDV